MHPTNTAMERLAIDGEINLSDGHARHPLTMPEARILGRLSDLYHAAIGMTQSEVERAFADSFFRLAGEPTPEHLAYSYSTSCLVALIAQSLADEGRAVVLPEPSFDNIRDLLIRSGVAVEPIPESEVLALTPSDLDGRALWLTMPNNPTGWSVSPEEFSRLLATVKASDSSMLVVDFCFRLFCEDLCGWSQYDALNLAGVDFLALEDTGKTFSLLDVKAGMLAGSPARMAELALRNEEVLLNVSPWMLLLLREFCDLYSELGLRTALWTPNRVRRDTLQQAIAEVASEFIVVGSGDDAPFVWLELTPSVRRPRAEEIVERARAKGLHLLPGTTFFTQPELGQSFLRIPTARSEVELRTGGAVLASVLSNLRG